MVPIIGQNGQSADVRKMLKVLGNLWQPVFFVTGPPGAQQKEILGGASRRLVLAGMLLEGAGRLDATIAQQQTMVDNAYRMADMLIEGDREMDKYTET